MVPQFHTLVYLRLLQNRDLIFRHYKNPYKHGMKGLAPTRGAGKGPTGPSLAPPTCPGYARLRAFSIRLSGSGLLTVVPHQKARSRAPPGYRPARHVGGTGFGSGASAPTTRFTDVTIFTLMRGVTTSLSDYLALKRGYTTGSRVTGISGQDTTFWTAVGKSAAALAAFLK